MEFSMTKKVIVSYQQVEALRCEHDVVFPADFDVFYSSIQEQKLRLEAEGWTELKVTISEFYDPDNGVDNFRLAFRGKRLETDEEYESRLKQKQFSKRP
jgi:hypothetical protein